MSEDHPLFGIPPEEVNLINNFLDCFVLASESGAKNDQIDIKLALMSVPSKVDD